MRLHLLNVEMEMTRQMTITVSGGVGENVRALVEGFPGTNANRVGRALVRMGLRVALRRPQALVDELRRLDTPWGQRVEVESAAR